MDSIFHQFPTVWPKSSENLAPVNPRSVLGCWPMMLHQKTEREKLKEHA